MKILKPAPHAVLDYAWAAAMMAAPWVFGFKKNRKATINSVASGAAILGLSLVTRYRLGAIKLVSFPTHGVIEAIAGAATALAPWTLGFNKNRCATLTHLAGGIGTLAIVAVTDYQAAVGRYGRYRRGERGAGLAEQLRGQEEVLQELEKAEQVDVGPETQVPRTAWTGRPM
jgi:hypothetical protein